MSAVSSAPSETSAWLAPSGSSLVGPSPSIVLEAQNKPLVPPKPKAFRLRSLPSSIAVDELRIWLEGLNVSRGLEGIPQLLQLSLAPVDAEYSHAIVTFSSTPSVFRKLDKGFMFPGPNGCEIEVDDHFLGLTVLYAPQSPTTAVAE